LVGTNIGYATHPYDESGKQSTDWPSGFGYLVPTYPVVATEFGQYCNNDGYVQALLTYMQGLNMHWTAWAWWVQDCSFPSIITDWNGDPLSPVGTLVQTALQSGGSTVTAASSSSASTSTSTSTSTHATTASSSSSATSAKSSSSTSSSSTTGSSSSTIVYADALENGFQDWSYATHSLTNTNPVHSGSDSISFTPDDYGAIYFHTSTYFTASTYSSIQFYVDGGSSSGQLLKVILYDNNGNTVGTEVPIPTSVPSNSWALETVSFSSFGVSSSQSLSGFAISANTANNQAVVYVDDISLVH